MSVMSKIRIPAEPLLADRVRHALAPQSRRAERSSPETKSRFLYTETSLCEAGQT